MPLPTGTNFPGSLDGVSNGYGAVADGDIVTADYANDQTSAIIALETVVGATPLTGTPYSTMGAALAGLVAALQDGSFTYATDSGTANAYAVTLSPTPPAYAAGQMVAFKAAHANTGDSTLAVNSATAQHLYKTGGTALASGDIGAGQVMVAIYDGSNFQLVGGLGNSLTLTGDVTGSGSGSIATTLASTGVTAGTYPKVTVNAKGQVTAGAALSSSDLPTITTVGTLATGTWEATTVAITYGGTGATTASGALSNLGAAANGANSDITSLAGLTTPLSLAQGGTNATSAASARSSLGAAASGANSDITSLTGLTTALSIAQGGTNATTASGALSNLGAAAISAVQSGSLTYASDTGSANAYAVALSPTPPAYASGQMVAFEAANANTGDSTLAVNGATAQHLYKNGSTVLASGDIVAGQVLVAIYDGTNFQLVGGLGSSGTLTLTGDVTGSGSGSIATTLAATGVTAGTYPKVTVNAKGQVTAGAALSSSDLPTITTVGTLATGTWEATTVAVAYGGTGATTASGALSNLGAAANGANSDITSLAGLTTPLSLAQGGTNATSAATARSSLGAAASGANSDITSLAGLTSLTTGGLQTGVTAVSANHTVAATDTVIAGTGGTSGITVTLPTASANPGKTLFVKKVDAGAGAVAQVPSGTDTIDGVTSLSLQNQYDTNVLISDGVSVWMVF